MLTPGEIRTAALAAHEGYQVTVNSVAGGSFTQVRVADADGKTVLVNNHQFEGSALQQFDELTATATADDAMEP